MRRWAVALWVAAPVAFITALVLGATSVEPSAWRWFIHLTPLLLLGGGFSLWRFSDPAYSGYADLEDSPSEP